MPRREEFLLDYFWNVLAEGSAHTRIECVFWDGVLPLEEVRECSEHAASYEAVVLKTVLDDARVVAASDDMLLERRSQPVARSDYRIDRNALEVAHDDTLRDILFVEFEQRVLRMRLKEKSACTECVGPRFHEWV